MGVLILLLAGSIANASDITWGGNYRVEAVKITNPELSSANSNKAYLLHHLVLTPKIQAADGLTIYSRMDVFNNPTWGIDPTTGQVYSVAGDVIGGGPNSTTTAGTNANNSNTLARTQRASMFALTEFYATWSQEFGQFIVGRAPMQFGLGTAFNAGNGLFDHYIDTRDMVGYKFVIGNFYMLPIMGKVNEGVLGEEDDVNDYMLQMQYDNPETDLSLGFLYQMRVFTFAGNDTPLTGGHIGGATPVKADGGKTTQWSLFMKQNVGNFKVGVEADMLTGDTGLKTAAAGPNVSLNGFGVAAEIDYAPEGGKTTWKIKTGMATGDDPGTSETYEGYIFSRNYDVAMMMFNHPLGQADLLRTGLVRTTTAAPNSQIDSEGLSNAIYFAPSFQTQWKENFSYGASIAYGILNKEPISATANTATSLGWELDINLTYKPYERLTWITEAGFLFPGDAWKAGATNNFETKFAYGLVTKAAITF
ncbi:MAG: hypothetical protein AAB250_04330 [Bdellovibrionota bacterium]